MARPKNADHRDVEKLPGLAPWIGGKRNLAARLIARIEAIPHTCYAEPFVGMGGIFLRRRRRAPVEAINDRGGDVANLFRILQRHPAALAAELRFALASRGDFERLRRTDPSSLTDVQRAARFYQLQYNAFGGRPGGVFGIAPTVRARFNQARLLPVLRRVHHRLQGVFVEQLDFADFIRRFDRPATLFYLDPPYWGCEDDYGKGLFGRADFARLADALRAIEGRFLLSLNDRPEVRAIFSGFRIERVTTTYQVSGQKTPAAELVIANQPRRS